MKAIWWDDAAVDNIWGRIHVVKCDMEALG